MTKIFVFGSNEAGVHGAGAARYALEHHGAKWGQGVGMQGTSYAIPTKSGTLRTLPLQKIAQYVEKFLRFAAYNKDMTFQVTAIGCGLAGYKPKDIAPMFKNAPPNCEMPPEWKEFYPDGVAS